MRISAARIAKVRSGFTLIEILVALAILGVVSIAGSLVFQGSLRADALLTADQSALGQREQALLLQFAGELEIPVLNILGE